MPRPALLTSHARAVRQIAILAAAAALFPVVALVTGGRREAALENARELIALQRALGIDVERTWHLWAQATPGVMPVANVVYLWAHVPVTAAALLWIYHHRPAAFATVRDVFLVTHLLTLAGYVLLPTAPPRLVGATGFDDTFGTFWGTGVEALAYSVQSPYAAMPSGHVAWALVAGGAMAALVRPRALRALCALYPLLITAVTVVTANHFLLDAVAALVVVAVAGAVVACARRLPARVERRRPAPATGAG